MQQQTMQYQATEHQISQHIWTRFDLRGLLFLDTGLTVYEDSQITRAGLKRVAIL